MAIVYDYETSNTITEGLQGSYACNEALRFARAAAADRGKSVVLDDDDGVWLIRPDGACSECDRELWESEGICRSELYA